MDQLTYVLSQPAFVSYTVSAAVACIVLGGVRYTPADFDHFAVDGGDLRWQTM